MTAINDASSLIVDVIEHIKKPVICYRLRAFSVAEVLMQGLTL